MQRRTCLRAAGALLLTAAATALATEDGFALITPEQARDEAAAEAAGVALPPEPLRRGVYPRLRVVEPVSGTSVGSPLRLALSFETSADARIVPATFRVLYGVLKIDLTAQLLQHARLDERGLVADGVMVPPGSHRLLLQIADDRGRVTEQELKLKVLG
jgi:hypothetical protein